MHNVLVSINWDDNEDRKSKRPSSVEVIIDNDIVELNESNNYEHLIEDVIDGTTPKIEFPDIDNYTKEVIRDIGAIYTINNKTTWQEEMEAQILFTAVKTDTLMEV